MRLEDLAEVVAKRARLEVLDRLAKAAEAPNELSLVVTRPDARSGASTPVAGYTIGPQDAGAVLRYVRDLVLDDLERLGVVVREPDLDPPDPLNIPPAPGRVAGGAA